MKHFFKLVFLFIFVFAVFNVNSAENNVYKTEFYNLGNNSQKEKQFSNALFASTAGDNSAEYNNFTGSKISKVVNAVPSFSFNFVNNQCSSSEISFSPTITSGPYSYLWNFGDGTTSTAVSPTHLYNSSGSGTRSYTVVLTITELSTSSQSTVSKTLTVKQSPDAGLTSDAELINYNGQLTFKACSNSSASLRFMNISSTTSSNTSYSINWGDGSAVYNATSWTSLSHNYTPGNWNITYTVAGTNGCSTTKVYKVFIGTSPTVSLGSPNSKSICVSTPLTFPITGTSSNPSGTIYTVTFNDGSTPLVYTHPAPTSVSYTFKKNSCGTTSTNGSTAFPNSFSASVVASNPCGTSSTVYIAPIYVSTPPTDPYFTLSRKTLCLNEQLIVKDSTFTGYEASASGCSSPKKIWTITPISGVVLNVGSYGNDFGSADVTTWVSGTDSIVPSFSSPGLYEITLKLGNKCGISEVKDTVCVEDKPRPVFTLDNLNGCLPLTVNANNTTGLDSYCSPITYSWNVLYTATNCGSAAGFTYVNSTNSNSENPSFQFTSPGTYTVQLTAVNRCGSQTSTENVIVKMPPQASITVPAVVCQTFPETKITPTATVNNCGDQNLTYLWSFPGGNPSTSTNAVPGIISYSTDGTYTVSLEVSNECGPFATSNNFTITKSPEVNAVPNQLKCEDEFSNAITFTGTLPGTTYNWVNSDPSIGLPAVGSGNINPFILVNSGLTVLTSTITVTPELNGCTGPSQSFTITVKPSPNGAVSGSVNLCIGATSPTITFTGSNGVAPYTFTYNINGGPEMTLTTTTGNSVSITAPTNTIGVYNYNLVKIIDSDISSCPNVLNSTAVVSVNPLPTIVSQPVLNQNVCLGATIVPLTATYTGGAGTVNYQWFSNTTNVNTGGTPIALATNPTFTPPVFNTIGTYYYYVEISFGGDGCGFTTSQVATVNVVADPIVSVQPLAVQTLCQNATPTDLTLVTSGGVGVYTYEWYSNTINSTLGGTPIPSANNDTYTPPTSVVGILYYYCVVNQTGVGCNTISAVSRVTVVTAPTIDKQPVSSAVCKDGVAPVLFVTYINGTGTPTYQWYSNGVDDTSTGTLIVGATNANYLPTTAAVGITYYYCVISLPAGGCNSIVSSTASVNVNPIPSILSNPMATQTVCMGGTIAPLTATYSGGAGLVSYQWFINTSNSNTGGSPILSANSASYTPLPFTATGPYYYYVEISFTGDGCGFTKSDAAEIIVVADPTISTQPLSIQTLCQNAATTNLTVTAAGGIGSTYFYQWFSNTSNTVVGAIPATSVSNNATFTPPTTTIGTVYYYCVVTQSGIGCDAISNFAEVNVMAEPTISNQPITATYCENETAIALNVDYINGAGVPTYQWFRNINDDTSTGSIIPSQTNKTYTPPTNVVGTMYYYCHVTLTGGGCKDVYSTTAKIVVNQYPVIASVNVAIGSGQTFTVQPSTIPGNIVPVGTTYTWTTPVVSPLNVVTGSSLQTTGQTEISQTLTNISTANATVTYTVTPRMGSCVGNDFNVVVTVYPPINPNVIVQNISCFGNNNGSIQTTITGGNQFTIGTPYIVSWTGPSGFTSSATTINNLIPGNYTLTINDNGSAPYVNTYTIVEPAAIALVGVKKDITCFGAANGEISLTVSGGTVPYTYSWLKNGVLYSNAKDLTNLNPGTYGITITDKSGCVFTQTYVIIEPFDIVLDPTVTNAFDCTITNSGAINMLITGGTQPYSYLWSNGATTKDLVNLPAGVYGLTVTDSRGCTQGGMYTVNRKIPISITVGVAKDYDCATKYLKSICTATITGGVPPYQLSWSSGTVSGSNNQFMETNQTGTYTLFVTDALSCTASYSFDVKVDVPGINYQFIDCDKHILRFNAVIPIGQATDYTYLWNFGDGSTSTSQSIQHTYANAGNYNVSLTLDNGLCRSIFVQNVFVETPPVITLDKLPFFCKDDSIVLHVYGADNYRWNNGTTGDSIIIKRAGDYSVIGISKAGCTSTLSFTTATYDYFNYTIQSDKNQVSNDDPQVRLWSESINYSNYFWDFGDAKTAEGNNIDHMYDINKDVYYDVKLKVVNPNGCLEYATKRIWVTSSTLFNTFTPNGDGIDDIFMANKHIQVYNRNGILIFDGTNGWDGTYKNKDVSNDTYFFILYYGTISGLKTNTGFVTVIR